MILSPPLPPTQGAGRPSPTATQPTPSLLATEAQPSPTPEATEIPPATVTATSKPLPTTTPTPTPTTERQIEDLIRRWAEVKAYTDRTGDPSRLSTVLAGKLLEDRIKGAQWLREHGARWEITLHEMRFETIQRESATRYRVVVFKDESQEYYPKGATKPTQATYHDRYRAWYTVEMTNAGWRITAFGEVR